MECMRRYTHRLLFSCRFGLPPRPDIAAMIDVTPLVYADSLPLRSADELFPRHADGPPISLRARNRQRQRRKSAASLFSQEVRAGFRRLRSQVAKAAQSTSRTAVEENRKREGHDFNRATNGAMELAASGAEAESLYNTWRTALVAMWCTYR